MAASTNFAHGLPDRVPAGRQTKLGRSPRFDAGLADRTGDVQHRPCRAFRPATTSRSELAERSFEDPAADAAAPPRRGGSVIAIETREFRRIRLPEPVLRQEIAIGLSCRREAVGHADSASATARHLAERRILPPDDSMSSCTEPGQTELCNRSAASSFRGNMITINRRGGRQAGRGRMDDPPMKQPTNRLLRVRPDRRYRRDDGTQPC